MRRYPMTDYAATDPHRSTAWYDRVGPACQATAWRDALSDKAFAVMRTRRTVSELGMRGQCIVGRHCLQCCAHRDTAVQKLCSTM